MNDGNTILLQKLVDGQDDLNEKFGRMLEIEAARSERESNQKATNERFGDDINDLKKYNKKYEQTLIKVSKHHATWDKILEGAFTKVVTVIILGVGAAVGFNWLG